MIKIFVEEEGSENRLVVIRRCGYTKALRLARVFFCVVILLGVSSSVVFGGTKGEVQWLFETRGVQKNHSFNRPQGMFLNNRKIYIADTDNREVAVFALSGEPVGILQTDHPLAGPVDISVGAEGKIYISCREKDFLEVFDAKGKFLYAVPSPSSDFLKRHEFSPGRFVLSPAGKIYAVNRKKAEVWVFEPDGSLAFRFGGRGPGQGKFGFITDIFFHKGKIYLTDAQGIPVQVFSSEGEYLYSFGKHGQQENDFSFPRAISVDRDQRIWVVDAFRHRVSAYDQKGNFLFSFGSYGTQTGKFCFPVDLDFDDQDRLYILEKSGSRFQVFQIGGRNNQS